MAIFIVFFLTMLEFKYISHRRVFVICQKFHISQIHLIRDLSNIVGTSHIFSNISDIMQQIFIAILTCIFIFIFILKQ